MTGGSDQEITTGTAFHDFGLLDAWDQATASGRNDNYLFLDTGWLALGAINACHGDRVRQRFAAHPLAVTGHTSLAALGIPCPGVFDDGFESGDTAAWSLATNR